jgi:hypothetical protein
VPDRRLAEGARVRQKRRDPGLSSRRVEAVDEVPERIQGDVLGERHPDREPPVADVHAAASCLEGEAEERAVERVECESERTPAGTAHHGLAEDRDVRVVAAEETLVDGLESAPDGRCDRAGRGRMEPALRHNRQRA